MQSSNGAGRKSDQPRDAQTYCTRASADKSKTTEGLAGASCTPPRYTRTSRRHARVRHLRGDIQAACNFSSNLDVHTRPLGPPAAVNPTRPRTLKCRSRAVLHHTLHARHLHNRCGRRQPSGAAYRQCQVQGGAAEHAQEETAHESEPRNPMRPVSRSSRGPAGVRVDDQLVPVCAPWSAHPMAALSRRHREITGALCNAFQRLFDKTTISKTCTKSIQ